MAGTIRLIILCEAVMSAITIKNYGQILKVQLQTDTTVQEVQVQTKLVGMPQLLVGNLTLIGNLSVVLTNLIQIEMFRGIFKENTQSA